MKDKGFQTQTTVAKNILFYDIHFPFQSNWPATFTPIKYRMCHNSHHTMPRQHRQAGLVNNKRERARDQRTQPLTLGHINFINSNQAGGSSKSPLKINRRKLPARDLAKKNYHTSCQLRNVSKEEGVSRQKQIYPGHAWHAWQGLRTHTHTHEG